MVMMVSVGPAAALRLKNPPDPTGWINQSASALKPDPQSWQASLLQYAQSGAGLQLPPGFAAQNAGEHSPPGAGPGPGPGVSKFTQPRFSISLMAAAAFGIAIYVLISLDSQG